MEDASGAIATELIPTLCEKEEINVSNKADINEIVLIKGIIYFIKLSFYISKHAKVQKISYTKVIIQDKKVNR